MWREIKGRGHKAVSVSMQVTRSHLRLQPYSQRVSTRTDGRSETDEDGEVFSVSSSFLFSIFGSKSTRERSESKHDPVSGGSARSGVNY